MNITSLICKGYGKEDKQLRNRLFLIKQVIDDSYHICVFLTATHHLLQLMQRTRKSSGGSGLMHHYIDFSCVWKGNLMGEINQEFNGFVVTALTLLVL